MKLPEPELSVVIPTAGRVDSVRRGLESLAGQDISKERFEAVVVVDGDRQEMVQYLTGYSGPINLQFRQQEQAGPAAARNLGAELARGRTLLFLDDDLTAAPDLIRVHLAAAVPDEVRLGHLETVMPHPPDYLAMGMRNWWEEKLYEMKQEGHRFDYTDLLSGHLALSTSLFRRMQGFDRSYRCREDYEFGIRLVRAGIRFRFLSSARACHHETPELRKGFNRSRMEGAGDVKMARQYPEIIPALLLPKICYGIDQRTRQGRALLRCTEAWARRLERSLSWFERLHCRRYWNRVFQFLKRYWYYQGALDSCSNSAELRQILAANAHPATPVVPMALDLADGFPAAEAQLAEQRPAAVHLQYAGLGVGTMPESLLAEPVQPRHLLPALQNTYGFELLRAVALSRLTRRN